MFVNLTSSTSHVSANYRLLFTIQFNSGFIYHMNNRIMPKSRKFIEFYVQHVWNIHRMFVGHILTKRCERCAVSATFATLNENGICAHCKEGKVKQVSTLTPQEQKQMEEGLTKIFDESAGKGKWKYDALIFFSGGKDSTYLLHRLQQDHPNLRILAMTVDNGFMSAVALQNIKEVTSKIGVDHIIVRPNMRMYEKLFNYAFTHLAKNGAASCIDVLDGELRFDIGRHYAAAFGIPLIIIGFSREQVETYIGKLAYESSKDTERTRRTQLGPYAISELPLSTEERELVWDHTRYRDEQIARIIYPLVVWHHDEEFIKSEVVKLGLVSKENVSPLVTNHELIPLMAIVDVVHLGYSSWEPEFARMIREGKANRIYWRNLFELIEYSAKTGSFLAKTSDELLARLGLSRKDVGIPE